MSSDDLLKDAKNLMLYQMAAGMHKTMQNEASNDMQSSNDDFLHKNLMQRLMSTDSQKMSKTKIEKMWM